MRFFCKYGYLEPSLFAYNFTCMFDYLKAGCSVFAILSGWYQQNECLLTLKHVRLATCLLSCFYTSSNIKLLKRINWLQTRLHICLYAYMFVCLYVCMFACLYVCMLICLHACMFVITTSIISYYKFYNLLFCLKVWLLVCLLDNLKFFLMRLY